MRNVQQVYRLACPKCGEDDRLQVLVDATAGNAVGDWPKASGCACLSCGFQGQVECFTASTRGEP